MPKGLQKPKNGGVSDTGNSQAQQLYDDLQKMGARLERIAGKLRSLQRTAISAVFLDEDSISGLIEKNTKLHEQVIKLQVEIEEYLEGNKPITVVVAGGFSSGKSTFLNGLLGIELLIMEDAPASKMVVNIQYGPKESYYLVSNPTKAGGERSRQMLSRDELREYQLGKCQDTLPQDAELEINLDHELLHSLTLIDTPGLKAVKGTGGDTEGTMRAVTKKSDMLFWLLDARKGAIPEGDKSKLSDLAASAFHPVIILNMLDAVYAGAKGAKNPNSNERLRVREEVTKELNKLFRKKDYTLLDYSARLVLENQPTDVKRKYAINILIQGFAEALHDSRFSTSTPTAGNTLIVSALEGPLLKDLSSSGSSIELSKSDHELITAKTKLTELLYDTIKNRSNLMLRFDLATTRIKNDIDDLESSIKAETGKIDKAIQAKKSEVIDAFEKGASHFRTQFSKKYNKLLYSLHEEYVDINIKRQIIRKASFWHSFQGQISLITKFKSHNDIKREGLGTITNEARKFSDEFGKYGLTEEITDRFNEALGKLIDSLSEEACKDIVDIAENLHAILSFSMNSGNEDVLVFNIDDESLYNKLPSFLYQLFIILLENKVLSEYCEGTFIQESRRSIKRFFDNLEVEQSTGKKKTEEKKETAKPGTKYAAKKKATTKPKRKS